MPPPNIPSADCPDYYDVPARDLMKRLPGEYVVTPADVLAVQQTKGYDDLIRSDMSGPHAQAPDRGWQPGDLSVTTYRGHLQVNVLGSTTGKPQYVWLSNMVPPAGVGDSDAAEVKNPTLVRRIAQEVTGRELSGDALHDFAMQEVHGKNVRDSQSLIRIEPNIVLPMGRRTLLVKDGGNVRNMVGEASLSAENRWVTEGEQVRRLIEAEAGRFKVDVATLLDPERAPEFLKHSAVLRKLLRRMMAQGK